MSASSDSQLAATALLVVGYGNTLRSDDGVGPMAAEAIEVRRLPGVRTLACALLTPELAEPISQCRTLVFVDAAVDAPREVQLREIVPAESSQLMAHAASPATMLALAQDVFGHAPGAWLLTIPVEHIGIGEQLSEFAQRGLAEAVERIKGLASKCGE